MGIICEGAYIIWWKGKTPSNPTASANLIAKSEAFLLKTLRLSKVAHSER